MVRYKGNSQTVPTLLLLDPLKIAIETTQTKQTSKITRPSQLTSKTHEDRLS
ncbi:hypothetical protein AVDCRST_MAG92-1779 [uncultured Coleofasciculus sp.]|uniref:Uncharacterized protein n=1 Tax=uncultured Coleofasciculus sp. TaxID=1267456 RepID=A0A6J4I9B5_9CYAN|nr:hypothetical protein AVDCRST_MAG92-1779 [uncultured Coleofasciculus sp.]